MPTFCRACGVRPAALKLRAKDGLLCWPCRDAKPANKKARQKYRQADVGKIARQRYQQGTLGRQTVARGNAKALRDPIQRPKLLARAALKWAVRSGRLRRLPCAYCGMAKSEGHHKDYAKPLDVVWLCRPCHRAEHKRETP